MAKMCIALLFGGRSGEHEVSCKSAAAVARALKKKYNIFPIGISKTGQWYGPIPDENIETFAMESMISEKYNKLTLLPYAESSGVLYTVPDLSKAAANIDVFFPVLHGSFGEDGTVQGLFELAQVPYAGSGVLASSAGMDKILMKKVFAAAGLPQVEYLSFLRIEIEEDPLRCALQIENTLGYPCFVKPANLGSSVGISKANDRKDLLCAFLSASLYDRRIIVEQGIEAREIEVGIIGNSFPKASVAGEILPCNEFYDYNAKYLDNLSKTMIPAEISAIQRNRIEEIAINAYRSLDASGLSRIDFFISKKTGEIFINEINTMPGFTSISMFPKLWEYSGLKMEDLLEQIINYALEKHRDKERNKCSY